MHTMHALIFSRQHGRQPSFHPLARQKKPLIGNSAQRIKACRAVIGPLSQLGQKAKYSRRADVFRLTPKTGHRSMQSACPKRANSGSETFHSITSSARARSDGGTVRPSRFGRPMRSCVVNSKTRSTLALFEHFQRPVGVHGHYQLAADHLEHGQVGIDHERYALQRHHRNPPPDPELACDHLIAVR
jgi:hypothetical protein